MYRIGLLCVIISSLAVPAHAYRMPAYHIAAEDWGKPAEEVLQEDADRMDDVASLARLSRLENHRRCHTCRLNRKEKKAYREYRALRIPYRFWSYVVDLKRDLIMMVDGRDAEAEADLLAKKIIQKLYDLSNEYEIAGSALIHNALMNAGVKEKGFCYQYADALRKMLAEERWRHFEFRWGAAYDRTFLENNGLVIVAKGRPFESGIVIDPWRTASQPYWHAVDSDRYPWVEVRDVEMRYDLTR
jgi:hypothetical protein